MVAAAVALCAPLVVVVASVLTPSGDVWRLLWATSLPRAVVSSLALAVCVGGGALVIGTGLALLTTLYRFPGRRLFTVALCLPLAMPAYVLAFVVVGTFDLAGPMQGWLRDRFGPAGAGWVPEVRSFWGAVAILTLVSYPYVFLLARSAFLEQAPTTLDAARTLGCSPLRAALRVAVPLARPSLAAGTGLVLMETLADFAVVRQTNVPSVADEVVRVWLGFDSRGAASEIAALLVGLAATALLLERLLRGRARFVQAGLGGRRIDPVHLRGTRAAAAVATCGTVVAVAFVLPVARLVQWALTVPVGSFGEGRFDGAFWSAVRTSLAVGAVAAAVATATALGLAVAARRDRLGRTAARLAVLGYAVPGPVIALGALVVLGRLDAGPAASLGIVLIGSLTGLVYAHVVRFLAVGFQSADASLDKVPTAVVDAARTLGAGPVRVAVAVVAPMLRVGLVAALAMTFLDVVKELPASFLLRPVGADTLSVLVYRLTADSRWHEAAVPALAMVALCLPLLAVALWASARPAGSRRGDGAPIAPDAPR